MGDLSKNFSRWEFRCRCSKCQFSYQPIVDAGLVNILQELRDVIGRISLTSGHRCPEHNAVVGGEPDSYHLIGGAADCHPHDAPLDEAIEMLERILHRRNIAGGIGRYVDGGVFHIDIRDAQASRWDK